MLASPSNEDTVPPSRTLKASSISSPSESEAATYVPLPRRESYSNEKKFSLDGDDRQNGLEGASEVLDESPGDLPDSVYERQLPRWRFAFRQMLIRSLKHESRVLGFLQTKIRTPWLDSYMLYTSALGSHTFFMSALPALFYFGYSHVGRGLLQIMCVGVYASSFMKDCFCAPRPFTSYVTRLSIGTHHLEYGFPSTHSTNAMSFVTYLYILLRTSAADGDSAFAPPLTYGIAFTLLVWYAASIVLGRLYCGMHSFTDCIVGTLLGISIGAIQGVYGERMEEFIAQVNWVLPVVASLLCLLLTNQHPQPVDDCPCFEDAIASLALLTGTVIARWYAVHHGHDVASGFYTSRTPGWENLTWGDGFLWWSIAILKMVSGVSAIFAWRLIVKYIMHSTLPPLFRWASSMVGEVGLKLPNRRWYTPATEYERMPSEGIHPIPSSMNLPAELSREDDVHATGRLPHAHIYSSDRNMKRRVPVNGARRAVVQKYVDPKGEKLESLLDEEKDGDENIKHYDADVLTKVIVYSGIGVIATYLTPVAFELLRLGVQPAT